MLSITDNRKIARKKVQFADLPIGTLYEDKDGVICIKTNSHDIDGTYGSCIALINDEWRYDEEHYDSEVIVLEATVVLNGYK